METQSENGVPFFTMMRTKGEKKVSHEDSPTSLIRQGLKQTEFKYPTRWTEGGVNQ